MEELFVPYSESIQLKELGFDEPCLAYHTTGELFMNRKGKYTNFVLLSEKTSGELAGHGVCKNSLFSWLKENGKTSGELFTLSNSVAAPTFDQVFKWFRKEHGIHTFPDFTYYDQLFHWFKWFTSNGDFGEVWKNSNGDNIVTYEEMDLERIRKSIELLKNSPSVSKTPYNEFVKILKKEINEL